MKRKGWLIPILVFVVSFVCLIFYQQRQDSTAFADTTNMTPILWSKSAADITKVVYKHSGQQLTADRKNDKWFISEPIQAQGDALYIYNVISAFKEPLFEEVIETSPTNLELYGINKRSSSITMYDNEGNEYILVKGNTINSLTDYVYAPLSDTVYTISHSAFTALKTDVNSWRNKDLLNFSEDTIKKIKLTLGGQTHIITPEYAGTEPQTQLFFKAQNLNTATVTNFISYLSSSKIQKFITNNPDAAILDAYGFNKPSLKITITLNDGSTSSLTMGNVIKDENICYIKRDDSNSIFGITYFDLSQLKVTPTAQITNVEKVNNSSQETTTSAINN
ncbi:DUF4340 domain-containing protein [Cellulosilyticum ruminicola]|uniref:DUF4340 domain-containing protein n=1 Tax=Cellulosilyticum ruminicola TaxID=425254 RepID=UPI0006D26FE5|nr:DUF4340 domain-containing protein [Cellulosilyticum ruminicola]